jgi:putative hemolysin
LSDFLPARAARLWCEKDGGGKREEEREDAQEQRVCQSVRWRGVWVVQ